jgi:ADP-ribose pyrophosphatase
LTRQICFQGRKISVAVDTTTLPDGRIVQRDIVLHPGAVAILPLVDPAHVCLLRNVRQVVGDTLWEIPAGTLEPNEAPEQAAIRELAEETGYQAGHWRKLGEFFPSPGILSERTRLFIAQDLVPGVMRPEADEELAPHVIPWHQAISWAIDGTVRDAKTLVALFWWDRVRNQE